MKYRILILAFVIGYTISFFIHNSNLEAGDIIFTNLKSEGDKTISDVILVGERKFFKRDTTVLYSNFVLYDQNGNRLNRILNNDDD
jgi:hypothetical protein